MVYDLISQKCTIIIILCSCFSTISFIYVQDEVERRYLDQRLPLPAGVKNIDDEENPQLAAEYAHVI